MSWTLFAQIRSDQILYSLQIDYFNVNFDCYNVNNSAKKNSIAMSHETSN